MNGQIESVLAKVGTLYRGMPQLPAAVRSWIARNIWWIALVGAVVGAVGVLSLLLITALGAIYLIGAVFLFTAKFGSVALLLSVLLIAALIANTIILSMAVSPLKSHSYKGWHLLVVSLAVNLLVAAISVVLKQDVAAFIWDIIWIGAGGYLVFEIQPYFQTGTSKATLNNAPEYRPAAIDKDARP